MSGTERDAQRSRAFANARRAPDRPVMEIALGERLSLQSRCRHSRKAIMIGGLCFACSTNRQHTIVRREERDA